MQPPVTPADTLASPSTKKSTIARLLKVARQEFSEKGYAGARVDEIARMAGVTKQLVYHYFCSKDQLFACVLDESAQEIVAELMALEFDHLDPPQAMRAFLNHAFDQYRDDPTLGSLASEGLRHQTQLGTQRTRFLKLAPALSLKLEGILRRGEELGVFRPGIDPRLFFAASALLTTGAFTNRYMLSAISGFDTADAEGTVAWREYSVNFVMSAILADQRPLLERPPLGAQLKA